ncbi:ATP-binding protein [Pseudoduganella lutea]|uniref:ATP-binding protein n=1 Tax=Pseudoduganella lutea TaxID=321985 RepID=UPI003530A072
MAPPAARSRSRSSKNAGEPPCPSTSWAGHPAERRERIFGYLARDVGPSVAGWGIGLPSAQSIAKAHGGSVSVDCCDESGTTFTIEAPVDCRPFVRPAIASAFPPRRVDLALMRR